jgi:hypothetical protein
MSQQAVSFVIHTLLTNQEFRSRFVLSPMDVLVDLHLSADIELTLDEVEALVRASPDVWRSTASLSHAQIH